MLQVWSYETYNGRVYGVMVGFTDHGGTDVSYRFRRIAVGEVHSENNRLDILSGGPLKAANRIGALAIGAAWQGEA